jgi:uncharacterized protein (TIGR03545 family)
MKLFRWKAIVPMLVFAVLLAVFWVFYVDRAIRKAIEFVGTEIVGAKVELESARLRLVQADLVLKGLQVTDPNQPMRNLFEIPELVADLNGRALLSKKVVVETLAVRGMRFGTPRQTSGAIENPSPATGLVTRRVLDWANGIPVPTLDLAGLAGTVVRVEAINADSLRTLRQARLVQAAADSTRSALEARIRGLDPQPVIDSARALVTQLQGTDPRRMSAAQAATTAAGARSTIQRVTRTKDDVIAAKAAVDSGVAALRGLVGQMDEARQADYAYARGLLNIPSLAPPDISMSLFGAMAIERLKPVLYWVHLAEQYIPPGLDPRRDPGPERLRMAGTTYRFPFQHAWPAFLLEHADADLAIGGETVVAGAYRAVVTGATTEPTVYGRPMYFSAGRTSNVGPRDLRVGGMMDRVGAPRDSVTALVPGVTLPAIPIGGANATLDLGRSTLELVQTRSGAALDGIYRVTSDAVQWRRTGDSAVAAAAPMGSRAWAEGLLWRAISSVPNVSIEARIGGTLEAPRFALSSNVGDAVSASLRQALGQEVQRAEAQARAQVDRLVAEQTARARAQLTQIETELAQRLGVQQGQLAQVEQELRQQVTRLTQQVPGVQLPGGIRLPRR